MTILSVVKDVCATIGVTVPQSMFSNITGNRTMQEMLALANEAAQAIAYDKRDWTTLKTTVTYTGDGVTSAYNLPANYKRMLLTSNVWSSNSTQAPMTFVPDLDEWLIRRVDGWNTAHGEWTMYGGQIHFWPVLGSGETAFFAYLDKNCVALSGGGYGNAFLSDTDGFRLDERILKLCMIWKWKAQKGAAYAEDMSNYEDAVAVEQGHDSPSPIIVGRLPISASVRASYPLATP